MTDMLSIKNGSFQAEIILDKLPELPLENIKKLFKIMFKAPWDNRDTIETLGDRIRGRIENAKDLLKMAAKYYADGWRIISNKRSRNPDIVAQLQKNAQLTSDFHSSKTRLEKWEKILTLYEKEKKS